MADPTAQIMLKRLRRPIGDVLRTYKVVIDGDTVGDIRRGENKAFDVPPGRHEIHLEIDRAKSRNLELNLSSGDIASLTCSARPPNAGRTVLASKDYIKLEIVDGSWLAVDDTFRPEPPPAAELAPGAPDDEEIMPPGRPGGSPPIAPPSSAPHSRARSNARWGVFQSGRCAFSRLYSS